MSSGGSSNYRMAATTTGNGYALASLLCSIFLFCVPGVGGLLAIVLGFLGIQRAKVTNDGKGMAIAGMIIGAANLVFGVILLAIFGGAIFGVKKALEAEIAPAQATAQKYIVDLNAGNLDAAGAESDLAKDDIKSESELLKPLGAFQTVSDKSWHIDDGGGLTLLGTAKFASGQKKYKFRVTGSANSWKIESASFE